VKIKGARPSRGISKDDLTLPFIKGLLPNMNIFDASTKQKAAETCHLATDEQLMDACQEWVWNGRRFRSWTMEQMKAALRDAAGVPSQPATPNVSPRPLF
jgi:hypothetical protein